MLSSQQRVTGTVRVKLYKGQAVVIGRFHRNYLCQTTIAFDAKPVGQFLAFYPSFLQLTDEITDTVGFFAAQF